MKIRKKIRASQFFNGFALITEALRIKGVWHFRFRTVPNLRRSGDRYATVTSLTVCNFFLEVTVAYRFARPDTASTDFTHINLTLLPAFISKVGFCHLDPFNFKRLNFLLAPLTRFVIQHIVFWFPLILHEPKEPNSIRIAHRQSDKRNLLT